MKIRQELSTALEEFDSKFKRTILSWESWRNRVLCFSLVAWLMLGVVVALTDDFSLVLFLAYLLSVFMFWIILLYRIKNTNLHLWLKANLTPQTVPLSAALLMILIPLPLFLIVFR